MMRIVMSVGAGVVLGVSLACGGDMGSSTVTVGGNSSLPTMVCPPGALQSASIAQGTSLTLVALHPDDAYSSSDTLDNLPIIGSATEMMTSNGDCWMGGSFASSSGESFYFYKAAFVAN